MSCSTVGEKLYEYIYFEAMKYAIYMLCSKDEKQLGNIIRKTRNRQKVSEQVKFNFFYVQ